MIPTFPSRLTTATAMVFGLIALSRVRYISKPAQAHIFRHLKFNWDGSKRLIFVGDVHGCVSELQSLLDKVNFQKDNDVLFFVGDLVRKGPDSKAVVELARRLNAYTVRGNHDQYAILDKLNKLGLGKDDLEYLRSSPLSITIPELNILVVHAGMVPGIPVEKVDPQALMTMRNLVNSEPTSDDKEGVPWITLWKGPRHVIFGHDAKRGLQKTKFATGLDTGCVYGKLLTALILPDNRFISIASSMPIPENHKINKL